jgi:hypothetical protein
MRTLNFTPGHPFARSLGSIAAVSFVLMYCVVIVSSLVVSLAFPAQAGP